MNNEEKYQTSKLGDVADVGSSHRVFTSEFVKSGIPFYRGTEIGKLARGEKIENQFYISPDHYKKLTNIDSKPKKGDILMPSICDKGQVWLVDTDDPFYYKDGRVLSISPNENILNPSFLQSYLKIKTQYEYPKLGSGTTFGEFKIFQLKQMDIQIPPKPLQNEFVEFKTLTDKSKFEYF